MPQAGLAVGFEIAALYFKLLDLLKSTWSSLGMGHDLLTLKN